MTVPSFSYLRELLDFKVKRTIEALPFTSEGYSRAESILAEKYGKESEIVNTYTREILDIRSVPNTNPKKISEKLTYCVQALQTLKKLEQVNGAVTMTLDKLPAIRGDLVRTYPDWENWDFANLSEAIRPLVRRNPAEKHHLLSANKSNQPNDLHVQPRCIMRVKNTLDLVVEYTATKIIGLWNAQKLRACQIAEKFY